MNDEIDRLEREALTFARLLTGAPAATGVVADYVAAHASRPQMFSGSAFQERLVDSATGGVFRARMADGYARFFDPHGPLRRKLVLLLAILESTPPTHRQLDAPVGGSLAGAFLPLVAYGIRSVFCTLMGTLVHAPRRLFSRGER